MKITCQSCQSKYTVSDEKVQGKTVKIKCRKCGATILVNSGGVTTNAPADPVSLSSGGQAEGGSSYLVNVADGDQRSMTLPEIVAAYQTSVVTADTYVWADGMGDWQPLGQVDSIVAALHAQPAAQAAPAQLAASPGGEVEHRAAARREQPRAAHDPFGARPEEVASSAAPYTNGSSAGAAMRSSPMAAPSAPRAAEENSMLFSLSALTAKPAASAPKATTARDKEDSGIIDLKALAASAAPAQPAAAAFLPDGGLFPLGAPIVAAPAAAPPVVTPPVPPPKSKAPLFLGIGGVVAVGAIVGAFLIMKGSPPPPPAAPATTAEATATATATAAPTATATADATAAPTASAEASAAPTSSAVAKAGKGGKAPAGGGKAAAAPAGGGKAASPAAASPAPAPAGPKRGNCGCAAGDLMCAMKCSAK